MSRREYDDSSDAVLQHSTASLHPDSLSPGRYSRRTSRRERTSQQVPQPIPGIPSPVALTRGPTQLAPSRTLISPPPRVQPSPTTEIAVLPDGGVEIPLGMHFDQADQGHYRSQGTDQDDADVVQPRVLGGFGLGMLKGLRKLPAAIAGLGTRGRQNVDLLAEPPMDRENLPIDEDVETYVTRNDEDALEEEARIREEQLLRAYIQRHRMHRDRAFRRSDRAHRVPAPQPVPLPGSQTPVPSAVEFSQTAEAERIEAETRALVRAQEIEHERHIYAAEAVKPPSSASRTQTSSRTHRRAMSAPLPNKIVSRWTAQRDPMGRRMENRSDGEPASLTSPLTFAGFVRLMKKIHNMPWVGDRVAADYIPGGNSSSPSEYASSAAEYRISGSRSSYASPPPVKKIPILPSQSWYAARDSVLILPYGVVPPPGFMPFPQPHVEPPAEALNWDHPPSPSSQTHVESSVPVSAAGAGYLDEGAYHIPAEMSTTGQSYIFVPTHDTSHDGGMGGPYLGPDGSYMGMPNGSSNPGA